MKPLQIAICCPGPSLSCFLADTPEPFRADRSWAGTRADPTPGAGVVIAVNRAAEAVHCDWWCAGDQVAVEQSEPRFRDHGARRVFTSVHTAEALAGDSRFAVTSFESIVTGCPPKATWRQWSVTAAIVLAEWIVRQRAASLGLPLRHGAVHLYGVDWSGSQDWDGRVQAEGRTPDRWARERSVMDRVCAWAQESGLTIVRHGTREGAAA